MNEFEAANRNFLSLAVQYYIAARSAALSGLMPVSGNIYHHAIEMFLKAQLSKKRTLKQLKKGFRDHNLSTLWQAFKDEFPQADLEKFDDTIVKLNHFENIRYPDKLIADGAQMMLGWRKGFLSADSKVPKYEIVIEDIDRLIAIIFEICSVNPIFFMAGMNEYARESITQKNPASSGWFKT